MRKNKAITTIIMLICILSAQAEAEITTVPVGNIGNAGRESGENAGGYGSDRICGSVNYMYKIGKYEITAGQYRDFLNAVDPDGQNPYGLYSSEMSSCPYGCQISWNNNKNVYDFSGAPNDQKTDWENRPVNYVSWGDAARFANWMHNEKGNGDTETGSYNLNGATSHEELIAVTREIDATWVLPTEDEWYKAAYHQNNGATGDYYNYPTSTDDVPSNILDGGGNNATFHDGAQWPAPEGYTIGSPYFRTNAGEHSNSPSPYGTFDQGGNVWEWNETIVDGTFHGLRGGSFDGYDYYMHAANRHNDGHLSSGKNKVFGFRLVKVPEPTSFALLGFSGSFLILRRRK